MSTQEKTHGLDTTPPLVWLDMLNGRQCWRTVKASTFVIHTGPGMADNVIAIAGSVCLVLL